MVDTVVVAQDAEENTGYRFSWGLAIAGGVVATAVTFFLLTLGGGFGLMLVDPVQRDGADAPTMLTLGAIYFFASQAFGFTVGGYLAGRLLGPVVESHRQEEFRAAAHGLVAWAVTILATLTMTAVIGTAAVATGGTIAALYGAEQPEESSYTPSDYIIDRLLRPETSTVAATTTTTTDTANADAVTTETAPGANDGNAVQTTILPPPSPASDMADRRGEAGRIIGSGFTSERGLSQSDRERLADIVSRETGVTREVALRRIETTRSETRQREVQAAEAARQAGIYTSFWIAVSLLFGAALSMVAAVVARNEDDEDALEA